MKLPDFKSEDFSVDRFTKSDLVVMHLTSFLLLMPPEVIWTMAVRYNLVIWSDTPRNEDELREIMHNLVTAIALDAGY